jgi:hypothetical protein
MKYVSVVALLVCSFATGCSVRTERTVVEKPVAQPTAVVYSDSAPPPGSTVYVPVRQ